MSPELTKALDALIEAAGVAAETAASGAPDREIQFEDENVADARAEVERLIQGAVVPDISALPEELSCQKWAGMDGAVAYHLIDRYADGWADVGNAMEAWRAANAALAAPPAPAQPQWIPCSERMPTRSGMYIVTDGVESDAAWFTAEDPSRPWCQEDATSIDVQLITHWMPLPAAPTGDTK